MKKLLLFSLLLLLIPFLIFKIVHINNDINLKYKNNILVRVFRTESGKIERIPLEQYVLGVLSAEMPIDFDEEALKAQSVASRTYVLKQIERNIDNDYDVKDSVENQVYIDIDQMKQKWSNNFKKNYDKLYKIVSLTNGQILMYNGEIAETLFFSTSPGKTENSGEIFQSDLPYLRSVDSHWDVISPSYNNVYKYSLLNFYDKLGISYSDNLKINIISTTSTGRVNEISINENVFTGSGICSKLNIKSSYFDIYQDGDTVVVIGKGNGHGVGMSQYGAQGMAKEGYKYTEILFHYYENTKILNY